MTERRRILLFLLALAPALVVLALPLSVPPAGHRALAIAVFMIAGWLIEPVHPAFIGLLGCVLFWSATGAEFETAFRGFLTPTPWFVYGMIVIGVMADDTGLGRRLSSRCFPRALTGRSLPSLVGIVLLGFGLGLFMPSTVVTALLVTILAVGVVRRRDDTAAGGPVSYFFLAAGAYAAAAFGRPSTPDLFPVRPMLPWDLAAIVACVGVAYWLGSRAAVPAEESWRLPKAEVAGSGMAVWRIGLLLILACALWATTPLHGWSPAVIGLGIGLVACVPGIGAPVTDRSGKPDPLAVILAGAAISMPYVLAKSGGVDAVRAACEAFAHAAAGYLPGRLVYYWAAVAYHLFVPEATAEGAKWGALLASASGLEGPATAVWAAAGSTKLALYQSPALVLSASLAGFGGRVILKIGVVVVVAGSIAVLLMAG